MEEKPSFETFCKMPLCDRVAIAGRILCHDHAFPAERKKSNRRLAIDAQRAKVSPSSTDEEK
jgi:hypothetical protein